MKGRLTSADVEASVRDSVAHFTLVVPKPKVFDISFDLRSRFSLSHWDSMLPAACKEAGVTMLYSKDMDHTPILIVNLFA